jgi:hypothetical protein
MTPSSHRQPGRATTLKGFEPSDLFDPRTSVILCGSGRSLLHWVAYAFVADHPAGFLWGHVRLQGEVLEDSDILKTQLIPPGRFIPVSPGELARNEAAGNVAHGGLMRSETEDELVRRFAEFLRLPTQTQEMISRLPREGPSPVLVLSGTQRLAALYPVEVIGPTIRSIVEFGGSVLMTWAEAPHEGRLEFERVLHVKGYELSKWRDAVLAVEKGWSTGPLRTGAELRLSDVAPIATVLSRNL